MSDPSSPSHSPSVMRRCVMVCQHRSCQRNGSDEVLAAFKAAKPPQVFVTGSDCSGQCSSGPTVRVMPDQVWYCHIRPADVPQIVESHLKANEPVEALMHPRLHPRATAAEYQQRATTGEC